jgi:crotonobetainyl-CoA:carnitine CoA-transferase CaiB-like acyl-CoA transferase
VVDFSMHLAGPGASHLLTELGADVIKVEHWRGGDGNRAIPPLVDGVSIMHIALSAGTRSIGVDPRAEYWPELVRACCRWADIVIVNTHGDDARKRGLDFATLRQHNERLVHCTVTPYGSTGPWNRVQSHGPQVDAFAGGLAVKWEGDTPRIARGFRPISPTVAALYTALGAYAALRRRDELGTAIAVDISMWGSTVAWLWRDVTSTANATAPPVEYEDLGCRFALYRTSDRKAVLLAAADQASWVRFCNAAALADRAEIGDWSKGSDYGGGDEERAIIQARIGERPLAEWIEVLSLNGVPFAPALSIEEVLASDHAEANGVVGRTTVGGHDAYFPRSPIHIRTADEAPSEISELNLESPPTIGQHDAEVLRLLGIEHLAPLLPSARNE